MFTVCPFNVSELASVVCLKDCRFVTKVGDGFVKKVHNRVTALFHIWINKAFSRGLINNGVLIKLLWDGTALAGGMNIFYIHLPFDT